MGILNAVSDTHAHTNAYTHTDVYVYTHTDGFSQYNTLFPWEHHTAVTREPNRHISCRCFFVDELRRFPPQQVIQVM